MDADLTELIFDEELERINEQCAQLRTRYEELFSFIYDLRRADFIISTPQFIRVQELLVALVRNGEDSLDFERLKTYLAPLVCSSPEDQTAFYQLFDRWLETHQPPALLNDAAEEIQNEQEETLQTNDEKTAAPIQSRNSPLAATVSFILIIAFIIFLEPPPSQSFMGNIRDKESNLPLADAEIVFRNRTYRSKENGNFFLMDSRATDSQPLTISRNEYQTLNASIEPNETRGDYSLTRVATTILPPETTPATVPSVAVTPPIIEQPPPVQPTFYQRYYFHILFSTALLPFIIYGLWLLRRWRRRRQLERWRDENQPDFKNLTLEKSANYLYRNPAFRRAAQELRRHRRVPTDALDINRTVEATVREGGLFKPVLGTRQISPEYLVLIDRLGFRDQKGRLEDKILDRFKREGIFFDCFYFNRDPRLCRPKTVNRKGEVPRYFNLQELSMHYPEHRLLIFSDGAGMIDEFASRPHRWVKSLSNWETRALLTPNSALTYHEWLLEQEAGLPVLPAHEADLKTLVEIIRTGDVPKIKSYAANTNYPPTLLEDYEQWWLRRASPPRASADEDAEDKVETLCLELRYYLGGDGYLLLCACAVYPELIADLTFYLAHRFIAPDKREATLEALVCLPWFRQALMPDWLREELLADLTYEQETEVREAIERLLINYLEHPQKGFSLEIATQKKESEESFWQRWRRRKVLHDVIKTEKENSPLKDYVFLKFISGSKLAVSLPRQLSRFLQSQSDTRFAFLHRFYEACANAVKAIGNLWRKIYRRHLSLDGISKHKGVLVPLFVSLAAVGILWMMPPKSPEVEIITNLIDKDTRREINVGGIEFILKSENGESESVAIIISQNGNRSIWIDPGNYDVKSSAARYITDTRDFQVQESDTNLRLTVELEKDPAAIPTPTPAVTVSPTILPTVTTTPSIDPNQISNMVKQKLLQEYWAVLIASGGANPPKNVIFSNEEEVSSYQANLKTSKEIIGGLNLELQSAAMQSLREAIKETLQYGMFITPRGADAARRNYSDTVNLWASRINPGLRYWIGKGRITQEDAERIKFLPLPQQISEVLRLEDEGIFFSADFSKSILSSVPPPGASQHLTMLALDINEHGNAKVRDILAKHGWYQTIVYDLPHFTFLGVPENQLLGLGLKKVNYSGRSFWIQKSADSSMP